MADPNSTVIQHIIFEYRSIKQEVKSIWLILQEPLWKRNLSIFLLL